VNRENERRIEQIRAVFAAGARDELDEVLEAVHPDVVADWTRSRGPGRGLYQGRESVREFFATVLEVFDELEYFHDEFIPVDGDKVIRVGGFHGRGHSSGVEVTGRGAQVFEFSGDQLIRATLYQDKGEALAAVGATSAG
jgi:ketosteroid isomerase-like protein